MRRTTTTFHPSLFSSSPLLLLPSFLRVQHLLWTTRTRRESSRASRARCSSPDVDADAEHTRGARTQKIAPKRRHARIENDDDDDDAFSTFRARSSVSSPPRRWNSVPPSSSSSFHPLSLSLCVSLSLCLSVSLPFFIRRLKYKVPFPLRTYWYVEDDDDTFHKTSTKERGKKTR